ncbi:unnamed protein product [Phytomonas sp. Hart1]|nr:unnamed protein product [Phytomonas sp. Hart1]|eukprot:CCW71914.1 unnamed protein product [Phytomonas sp. isolate Hart1]
MALSTVAMTEVDVRAGLLENVVLTGGSSLFGGFARRFLSDTLRAVPRGGKIRVVAPAERGYAAWLGASFLSQLSTFTSMLTTREEYFEHGEAILQSRLFA